MRDPVPGRFWEDRVGDHGIVADIQGAVLPTPLARIGNGKDVHRR